MKRLHNWSSFLNDALMHLYKIPMMKFLVQKFSTVIELQYVQLKLFKSAENQSQLKTNILHQLEEKSRS